jgi:FixJ family two-component response regulator
MFTTRELEILKLIAEGHNTEAISCILCRTKETIKTHRKNIIGKVREAGTDIPSLTVFAIRYVKDLQDSE